MNSFSKVLSILNPWVLVESFFNFIKIIVSYKTSNLNVIWVSLEPRNLSPAGLFLVSKFAWTMVVATDTKPTQWRNLKLKVDLAWMDLKYACLLFIFRISWMIEKRDFKLNLRSSTIYAGLCANQNLHWKLGQ